MYEVTIDKQLFETYPDIRLSLIQFHTEVNPSDTAFWTYMDKDVLP